MRKIKRTNQIVMIIGAISIAAGIYFAVTGQAFNDYFMPLFLGITLFGTAYLNQKNNPSEQ